MKEFTLAEVAAHNTAEDLMLVIHDEVYEVSKFLSEVNFGEFVSTLKRNLTQILQYNFFWFSL